MASPKNFYEAPIESITKRRFLAGLQKALGMVPKLQVGYRFFDIFYQQFRANPETFRQF